MMRIAKFLVSGAIGAAVNLGLYFVLVRYGGLHYLTGSVLAIACAAFVGFLLQKFWTFSERSIETAHVQFALYIAVALFNIALNTGVVYALVEFLGVHYLLAQAAGAAVVAMWSFIAYHRVIFKRGVAESDSSPIMPA